jgi:hypothetical protein
VTRRENDFYPTPARATEVLLECVPELIRDYMFEPCVGEWDIAKTLKQYGEVITNDIDTYRTADHYQDARTINLREVIPSKNTLIAQS